MSEEQDFCEYRIYSRNIEMDEDKCSEMNQNVEHFHSEYIWHKNPFLLTTTTRSQAGMGLHTLKGKTIFGDCIDDEWFIVFLLLQLSLAYRDIVVRFDSILINSINDVDGEFLLIEAAENLPKDVDPTSSENRVFIHQGHLHLIPQTFKNVTLESAVDLILSDPKSTRASKEVDESALARCSRHPDTSKSQIHIAQVLIPHLAAHILHHCPGLISPAIEAFYTRDASTSKPCERMAIFNPSKNVPMTATFTKIRYSQLKSAQFIAPSLFRLPPKSDSLYRAAELGMKLSCGFEILYHTLLETSDSKQHSVAFEKFLKKLDNLGYYQGELEGSTLYQELARNAKQMFLNQAALDAPASNYLLGEFKLLASAKDLIDTQLICQATPDSDAWLSIDPSQVDGMLETKKSEMESDSESDMSELGDEEKTELGQLKGMLGGFQDFVGKESGVKGALFPGELSDESDSSISETDSETEPEFKPINFNADAFMEKMSTGFGRVAEPEHEKTDELDDPDTIESIMDAMDHELSGTHMGEDFERDEGNQVDPDLNLLKNVLSSVSAQQGLAGPASNIITSLGFKMPSNQ